MQRTQSERRLEGNPPTPNNRAPLLLGLRVPPNPIPATPPRATASTRHYSSPSCVLAVPCPLVAAACTACRACPQAHVQHEAEQVKRTMSTSASPPMRSMLGWSLICAQAHVAQGTQAWHQLSAQKERWRWRCWRRDVRAVVRSVQQDMPHHGMNLKQQDMPSLNNKTYEMPSHCMNPKP
jgi:hypothetical protein